MSRFDCECDRAFYECLHQQANSDVAKAVGILYFDKLQKKCFDYKNGTATSKIYKTPSYISGAWSIPS